MVDMDQADFHLQRRQSWGNSVILRESSPYQRSLLLDFWIDFAILTVSGDKKSPL